MSRKIRLRNPKLSTGTKVALGLAGLAAGGAVLYASTREEEKPTKKYGELPPPPETAPAPGPCDLGPRYPSFVLARNGGCVPSAETPAGIYVDPSCDDFAYRARRGPRHADPQTRNFDEMVAAAAAAGESVDPVLLATNYLKTYWPECPWPPAADGSARVVQLFMALSFQLGRTIWNAGGQILDASDADAVDEAVAAKLAEAGLENFEPDLVPEIVLPILAAHAVTGIPLPPVQPGVTGVPPPPPACTQPKDDQGHKDLPPATWSERKSESIILLAQAPGSPCKTYKLLVGACVKTTNASYGELTQVVNNVVLAPAGGVAMNAGFGQPPLAQFKLPHVYKRIFEVTVTFHEGAVPTIHVANAISQGIDPCLDLNNFWPKDDGGAFAVKDESGNWQQWMPAPKFKFTQSGNVILRLTVEYSGLPHFITKNDELVAQVGGLAPGSQFQLSYKVRSKGEA